MSIPRILAHEFGHAIMGDGQYEFRGAMDNVLGNENPIMRALGEPYDRTSYYFYPDG